MVEIIDYADEYAQDFRRLNLQWLQQYNLTEAYDLEIINDPKRTILDNGGFIYLARESGKIIGTAGIANEGHSIYELVKMAVEPAFRGKGIGKMLLDRCLAKARELSAKKIFLYSNSQLTTAIEMYKQYGFLHVDASNSPLLTADVKMELML